MQEIEHTIAEYQESYELINHRIQEINSLITQSAHLRDERRLLERRTLLYTQLWDIGYVIRELSEYLRIKNGLEVKQKIG